MRVCLSDGSIAFTGSKVVKSVAGYDIPKLFVGAWGTLGFIGEVTLKVAPIPQYQPGALAAFARCETACEIALRLAASPLFPLATTLHDRHAARRIRALTGSVPDGEWALVVRGGGTRRSGMAQVDAIAKLCATGGASCVEVLEPDRLSFACSDIAELAGGAAYSAAQFLSLKIVGLPSQVSDLCANVTRIFPKAELTAQPSAGIVYASIPVAADALARIDSRQSDELLAGVSELLDRGEMNGWSLSYLAAPPVVAPRLRFPVDDRTPIAMMRRIKAALDPSGTFDPGRFVSGI
jgi:glycolate oxidase